MEQKVYKLHGLSNKELISYCNTMDIKLLHQIKKYIDDIYYNTSEFAIDDEAYDILHDIIKERDIHYTVSVGTTIRECENRIELPCWLGSMDKYKPDDSSAIKKWMKTFDSTFGFIIEDKLDGVSCLIQIEKGSIRLYTRGDGSVGGDISCISHYVNNIPSKRIKNILVRGELIMKSSTFEQKYSKNYANARNMVTGLIGSKTFKEGINDIDFIAYEIIDENVSMKPSEQLEYLDDLGFRTVSRKIVNHFSTDTLIKQFIQSKEKSEYEIDGIIVQPNNVYIRNKSGNPEYAFAFKMRLQKDIVETKVIRVEWNISKWGCLKPRVEIEPVQISGVTITWTTGFDAKFIVEKSIGPNAIIEITRSGDVIPYIVNVIKKADKPSLPDIPYKWNESHVDIYTEEYQDLMNIKRIASFFMEIGVKHVGEKIVQKLYEHGYDTLLKIIHASKEDFMKVDGFKTKRAERTWDNIHTNLKDVTLSTLLGGSGVLGFGMGTKKIASLLEYFPDIFEYYKKSNQEELINRIISIEGFSIKTAQKIANNIEKADEFIMSLKDVVMLKDITITDKILQDKKIVLSGFRDKKIETDIINGGGKVMSSVSKQTSILVVASMDSKESEKVVKARSFGIPIITREQFINNYLFE
jgi:NAD-dependent DNA ligase